MLYLKLIQTHLGKHVHMQASYLKRNTDKLEKNQIKESCVVKRLISHAPRMVEGTGAGGPGEEKTLGNMVTFSDL